MKAKCSALILLVAAMLLAPGIGAAQQDISVNVYVNYGFAYRDRTWVPVDVVIKNEALDVNGSVEVRLFDAVNNMQSPTYRISAISPRGSIKRFRLHCFLDRTTRIEAMLLNGRRPVMAPFTIQTTSIKDKDFLVLILDREVTDYGFLSSVLLKGSDDLRFYRETLNSQNLSFLADFPQCYDAFNMIIMGDVDPERVLSRHRLLLRRYVESGGVLVIFTGADAARYRGTWVEQMLGVEIGEPVLMSETDLAGAAFLRNEARGTSEARKIMHAKLTPAAEGVQSYGEDEVIATRRPMGNGYVVAVSVDAAGRALQGTAGFAELWRRLAKMRSSRLDLNFQAAASACAYNIPGLAGVTIYSRDSVILYLGLYFAVAVVGNWLFFNRIKRREMAWLMLVVFAIAFTAYAILSGSVGRAKSSEIERIEVLHLPRESSLASARTFLGILSARSTSFSAKFAKPVLVTDLPTAAMNPYNPYARGFMPGTGEDSRPFMVSQDETFRADDISVRASEMRLIQTGGETALPGGVTGTLRLTAEGLAGRLTNETGIDLTDVFIFYMGRIYQAKSTGGGFEVSVPEWQLSRGSLERNWQRNFMNNHYFVNSLVTGLLSENGLTPQELYNQAGGGLIICDNAMVLAWTREPRSPGIAFDEKVKSNLSWTVLLAEVAVEREDESVGVSLELPVHMYYLKAGNKVTCGSWHHGLVPQGRDWLSRACRMMFYPGYVNAGEIKDRAGPRRTGGDLEVDLYWYFPNGPDFDFIPEGAAEDWPAAHLVDDSTVALTNWEVRKRTYLISDWNPGSKGLSGVVAPVRNEKYDPKKLTTRSDCRYSMAARIIPHGGTEDGGEQSWR